MVKDDFFDDRGNVARVAEHYNLEFEHEVNEGGDAHIDGGGVESKGEPFAVEFWDTSDDDFGDFGEDSASDEPGDEDECESSAVFEICGSVKEVKDGWRVKVSDHGGDEGRLDEEHGGPHRFDAFDAGFKVFGESDLRSHAQESVAQVGLLDGAP